MTLRRPGTRPPVSRRPPPGPGGSKGPRGQAPERSTDDGGLGALLERLDGAPFPAYRELLGAHPLGEFEVLVDHVPADPFAGPARVRLRVERAKTGLSATLVSTSARRLAVEDHLARLLAAAVSEQFQRTAHLPPGSGHISLEPPGPAMVRRSTSRVEDSHLEARLRVDLPAANRRIRGLQAHTLFFETLLRLGTATLLFARRRADGAHAAADLAEDHAFIQEELARRGLIAFVADGSLLARAGPSDSAPRRDGREVPFSSPDGLAAVLDLPGGGKVRGMGIPAGVTLLVGGAFHGKSTLLDALADGVHPHPQGDGRERVATAHGAVKVRSDVGRCIRRADLSAFFEDLGPAESSSDLSTEHAGGAVSVACAVVEAIEAGARVLLLDEDSCATSFLVRDGRMQRLVPRPGESLVPLVDRARDLYDRFGVSTVLATGASGDYLDTADTVIRLNRYRAEDLSGRAREIAVATRSMRLQENLRPLAPLASREPLMRPEFSRQGLRTGLRSARAVRLGDEVVDLSAVDQLVEPGQARALAALMVEAASRMRPGRTLADLLDELEALLDAGGLDALDPPHAYDLARPRRFEIAAALCRWRALRMHRPDRVPPPRVRAPEAP